MPLSTKQRITAITLLNLVYLVILLTVNHSDGDAAPKQVTVISTENLPPKVITENILNVKTRKSINNGSILTYNEEKIVHEDKLQDDVAAKSITGKITAAINGTEKTIMGESHSDNNVLRNDASNGAKVKNSDSVSPTNTQSLGRSPTMNGNYPPRRAAASRKLLAIELVTDDNTPSRIFDTHQALSQEPQMTLQAFHPEDQENLSTSLPRGEANSSHVDIKSPLPRTHQGATESSSLAYNSGDQEATKKSIPRYEASVDHEAMITLSKKKLEYTESSLAYDGSSRRQKALNNYFSGDQQINEVYFPGNQEVIENSFFGNLETTEASVSDGQEVNKTSPFVGHETTESSLPGNQVITETSFTEVSSPGTNQMVTESSLTEERETSSQESDQETSVDSLSGGGPKASQIFLQGGQETAGTSLPREAKSLKASRSEDQPDHINLDITVNMTGVTVAVNDQQVRFVSFRVP